ATTKTVRLLLQSRAQRKSTNKALTTGLLPCGYLFVLFQLNPTVVGISPHRMKSCYAGLNLSLIDYKSLHWIFLFFKLVL
ncbi:MAG: hypothetical protein J6A53_04465, partial [Clostridia bacterium]|nr:hypothetical protein [Clostridia bacterium]